jgi:putative membrane protein
MPDSSVPNSTRATEYLANERTFLAWIRTSIAVVTLGFVVAKFSMWLRELSGEFPRLPFRSSGASPPMGEALMAFGGLLAVLAAWHYHAVNRAIEEDRVKPNRALVLLITASVALLAAAMTVAMLLTGAGAGAPAAPH